MSHLLLALLILGSPGKGDAAPTNRTHLALGKDADLTATLSNVKEQDADQRPHLEITVQRFGKVIGTLTLDFAPERYPAFAEVLGASWLWIVDSSLIDLGPARVARLSLVGRAGEDLMVVQEIAILVEIEAEPTVLWLGLGDREENFFDACMTQTVATFRITQPGTLERRLKSTKRVSRGSKDDPFSEYRKQCKAPAEKRDVFLVGGGQHYGVAPADRSPAAPARR
jgi:hypothetical protein